MAFCIQMCRVLLSLEIYFPESVIVGIDASLPGAIKDGNAVITADFPHGVYHFLGVTSLEVLTVPSGKEKNLVCVIFLYESFAEYFQLSLEVIYPSDGIEFEGIVMSSDYDNIVEVVCHLFISYVHGLAPARAGISNAIPISAIIEVFHAMFLGKSVVPGIFNRFFVVLHIAVTNDSDTFSFLIIRLRVSVCCLCESRECVQAEDDK